MPLNPPQAYRKTAYTHRRDIRANQPLASDVLEGTLYFVTDEGIIERSNGVIWQTYSGSGSGLDHVPLATGAEPLEIMSDGAGNVFLVAFDPP